MNSQENTALARIAQIAITPTTWTAPRPSTAMCWACRTCSAPANCPFLITAASA